MNPAVGTPGVRQVLGEGWAFFLSGFTTAFPWVLAAELTALLPFGTPAGSIFTADLSSLGDAGYWGRALGLGALQAFLYGMAVQRLAASGTAAGALRALPAVLIGYLCYEAVVGLGLFFTLAMFVLGMFIIGPLGGLVLCILPLAPTAAISTAMALFIFPAVLEKKGPFASLGASTGLTKTSNATWVKVSLVISVPAIALLIAAAVGDIPAIRHAVELGMDLQRRAEEGLDAEQLLQVLDSLKAAAPAERYGMWPVAGVLLGALAWWYTLAVCYAQYRDLKAAERSGP